MNNKILITYASQGGATAGIAEEIGKTFAANDLEVDVLPLKDVADLSQYRAVVIGSAIHGGAWMPEAVAFITRHQSALQQMPTAVFQVCMMLATENEQYQQMVPSWLAPVRKQIQPLAEGSFAGALWPNRYAKLWEKLGLRIFLAVIHRKAGDYRDWDAVRAWALQAAPLLCR